MAFKKKNKKNSKQVYFSSNSERFGIVKKSAAFMLNAFTISSKEFDKHDVEVCGKREVRGTIPTVRRGRYRTTVHHDEDQY